MIHGYVHILKGYGKLLRGLVWIVVWTAALGALSAVITLPLWLIASRLPTLYTTISLIVIVVGTGWLLIGGRRPTGQTLIWIVNVVALLLSLALGWHILAAGALVLATGMVAYRLA